MSGPQRWALVIGVDSYDDGDNLDGCVSDALRAEAILRRLGTTNVRRLTAPLPGQESPGPADPRPTFANTITYLQELTEQANRGDFVCVFFSGHGSTTPPRETLYREHNGEMWKGPEGQDQSIAPSDCKTAGGIDDVTLGYMMNEMVEKDLNVTLILDSCFSGGAVREEWDEGEEPKDVKIRYTDPRPDALEKARASINGAGLSMDRLFDTWKKQQVWGGRAYPRLALNPSGYQLWAAAHEYETGLAILLGNGKFAGALSHHLFNAIEENPRATQRMLHRKVDDAINRCSHQAIIFEGEPETHVFSHKKEMPPQFPTTKVRVLDMERVELAAGAAHGVVVGAEYAIYRWDDGVCTDNSAPLVKVRTVFPLRSEAEFVGSPREVKPKKTGWRAVQQPPNPPDDEAHGARFKSILDLKNTGLCPELRGNFNISIENKEPGQDGIYHLSHNDEITILLTNNVAPPVHVELFCLTNQLVL